MVEYNSLAFPRHVVTLDYLWGMPRDLGVLEMAAYPYGASLLMSKFLFDNIELASFDKSNTEDMVSFTSKSDGKTYTYRQKNFNAETDPFPYKDKSFDLIVCCEMLEHLAMDPMHFFSEANRILKDDGKLFLTTPNAVSSKYFIRMLNNKTPGICPHYRLPGVYENIYKRHNRELTPDEVKVFLNSGGFDIDYFETINLAEPPALGSFGRKKFSALYELLKDDIDNRRDTIVAMAVKAAGVRQRFPTSCDIYMEKDIARMRNI